MPQPKDLFTWNIFKFHILLQYLPWIDDKSPLVRVTTLQWINNKPLPAPVKTEFIAILKKFDTHFECCSHTQRYKATWWRHQIETFSALLAICAGNSPVPGEFPAQSPVTRSFHVFFDLRIKDWVNNGKAGDLRRHRAHYDVIVMIYRNIIGITQWYK